MGHAVSSLKALAHLDLCEQLSFYGAYHRHPLNKLVWGGQGG